MRTQNTTDTHAAPFAANISMFDKTPKSFVIRDTEMQQPREQDFHKVPASTI